MLSVPPRPVGTASTRARRCSPSRDGRATHGTCAKDELNPYHSTTRNLITLSAALHFTTSSIRRRRSMKLNVCSPPVVFFASRTLCQKSHLTSGSIGIFLTLAPPMNDVSGALVGRKRLL